MNMREETRNFIIFLITIPIAYWMSWNFYIFLIYMIAGIAVTLRFIGLIAQILSGDE